MEKGLLKKQRAVKSLDMVSLLHYNAEVLDVYE